METENNSQIKSSSVEISVAEHFTDQMFSLCMNKNYSDVEFLVEGEHIPAHRLILANRSEYFRAMLFGGLSETHHTKIPISVPLLAFKALLVYLYTGKLVVAFDDNNSASLIDILELAREYGLEELLSAISTQLSARLTIDNVCIIVNAVTKFNLSELSNACSEFVDKRAMELCKHDTVKHLTMESFIEIIKRDSFCLPEIEIFHMVTRWKEQNANVDDIEPILSNVRFSLLNLNDLMTVVRDSKLLDSEKLLKVIENKALSTNLPIRTKAWEDEGLTVSCVNGPWIGNSLTFKLTNYFTINCIELTMNEAFVSIELSINEKFWEKVVFEAYCPGCVKYKFHACKALFIRVKNARSNNTLYIKKLKPMYQNSDMEDI